MQQASSPQLAFNYLPVRFSAGSFDGGVVAFNSAEQLTEMRTALASSHVVARDRASIACIPIRDDADPVGTPTTFARREYKALTMRLVQEALLRSVLGWDYQLRKRQPPVFVSRRPGKDLFGSVLRHPYPPALDRLHVYPEYRLDARIIGPCDRPGIIVGLKTRYEIDMTVAQLLPLGLDVTGRYVLTTDDTAVPDPDMEAGALRHVVGAVDQVHDGKLLLRDAPAVSTVPTDRAWLESRLDVFQDVLTAIAGTDIARLLRELDQASFDLLGGYGRYEKTVEIAGRLIQRGPLHLAVGLTAAIEEPVGSSRGRQVSGNRYKAPIFKFDQAGDKTDTSADRGLDTNGPFDTEFFRTKRPRIAVITPRAHRGVVETFMTKLLDGVPGAPVFSLGFIRKYHLSGYDVQMHPFDGATDDADAYRDTCRAALTADPKPDLAIVITSETQEHLAGDDSPYLVAKSTFMGQGVPVQEVQIETVRLAKPEYALNSIALACYAKLGGIPFVIAAPRALTQELVIGIGTAHVKASRLTAPERVVGITTIFSADGNYLLSNTSREADYDDYPRELLRSLTACINDIAARQAWQRGDELRLIFHVFKPLKDTEAIAVKQLVESLTRQYTKVEFAFVSVANDHGLVMFDRAGTGVTTYGNGPVKGRFVPQRGHAVAIGEREMLLAVGGPYDLKSATHAIPKPLLIKLHRESTFTDVEYLARQLFRFTSMSWRTMYPSRLPVTILYSSLIADLLGHLRHVRNWNADAITTQLSQSRWFL
ncbi:argonaute/piwi family protein [Actinoplanes subtropicus]|uniref:argonaute/piwi family protein n=1 Tax=Actinoplanes subtropicus TaxID=543632 RepID=UPI0004C2C7D8|nr:Piwi domain-containing protein [Actinoplanes subtropicus]